MCGIAGFSLSPDASVERTLAAQALLAAIAERGADAVGYAHRAPGVAEATVVKQRTPASELLERVAVPADASQLLIHVRDYTKGHPVDRGQQPPGPSRPRGRDPQRDHRQRRRAPRRGTPARGPSRDDGRLRGDLRARGALAQRRAGARAAARLDGRRLDGRARARSCSTRRAARAGRCGSARAAPAIVFASTKHALELVERYCGLKLRKRELRRGHVRRARAPARSSRASASA